jgi:hypothetical protein
MKEREEKRNLLESFGDPKDYLEVISIPACTLTWAVVLSSPDPIDLTKQFQVWNICVVSATKTDDQTLGDGVSRGGRA